MAEITVGSWNMLNSFGDSRAPDALEVIKRMDADVIFLAEMTEHGTWDSDPHRAAAEAMSRKLGYTAGAANSYSPYDGVRDAHTMAMWVRGAGSTMVNKRAFGQRYGMRASIPHMDLTVYGLHLDDANGGERLRSAEAVVDDWGNTGGEAVVMGDKNNLHRHDPRSRIPRILGRMIGGIEVGDYYDDSRRLQRIVGKVIRVCGMAEGEALEVFENAGLRDADPEYRPTIGSGRLAFQLDHILASSGLAVKNFRRHRRNVHEGAPDLSDHTPITATIVR